ncbi:MAG TPA: ABC transporter permease, partial [Flavobacterium sp.]|nr:ABC transporter permease [Flavobacterium sp.]
RNKAVKIRIAENLAVAFPFAILLIRHGALCEAALLFAAGLLLAGFSFRTPFNFTVPTPFYKKPFEFAAGFRNTFYIFPIAYFLAYIAGSVENLNLGIAAMLAVFLVCANYYSKPENEYFVWIYAIPPKMFLVEKLKTAVLYSSLLVLPILASLAVFYPQEISAILLFLFLGLLFLVIVILVKYAAYPNKASVPEWIMVSMCINFPPLLLIFLPFLYKKSVKKLNMFLK